MQTRHTRTCSPLPTLCTLRLAAAKEPKARGGGSVGVPTQALINRCRPNARHTTTNCRQEREGNKPPPPRRPASTAQHSRTSLPPSMCLHAIGREPTTPREQEACIGWPHNMHPLAERGTLFWPQTTHACTYIRVHVGMRVDNTTTTLHPACHAGNPRSHTCKVPHE